MGKLVDITKQVATVLASATGITVKVRPSAKAINTGDLPVIPCIVLQGPVVNPRRMNFRTEYEEAGTNMHGTKLRDVRRWRVETDLTFRMRLFHGLFSSQLDLVENVIEQTGVVLDVTVGGQEYPVSFPRELVDNLAPNFSDLAHHEGELVVEQIEIRPEAADEQVHELREMIFQVDHFANVAP